MNYQINEIWRPGRVKYVENNIFQATEQYFLNPLPAMSDWPNLRNNKFQREIQKQFPYAFQMYDITEEQAMPGKIVIKGDGTQEKRLIVNMFTHNYPGYPIEGIETDTFERRKRYFISSLYKTYRIPDIKSICMMEKIGLPYGEVASSKLALTEKSKVYRQWLQYMTIIQKFALKFRHVKTVVYVKQDNIFRQIKAARKNAYGKFEYAD